MSTASSALPGRTSSGQADHSPGDDASELAPAQSRARALAAKLPPELGLLLVIGAILNLGNLGINGNANEYYSAAVHSMVHSWSAFFYGTFDSSGLMTVDKPPLALWIQALSARIFGFNTWSMLVPQALMGLAATALTYDLVRRRFGRVAGFVAGLALSTTPTAVAVFRHNNPDALLMLCSTVALWAVVRAFEAPSRTRWLVIAGVAVGLGFEAKMAAALLVVPAIVAAWLWVRPLGLLRSIRQVAAFSGTAAIVGLAWPVAVWLVPSGSRPWISGTSDNSVWQLIFGYNGLGRLLGQSGGPGGGAGGPGGGGGPAGGGGGLFGGSTGPLRLLNDALGSQGGWLLGIAVGSIVVLLAATRLRRSDARTGWLIATAGTFATTAVAFSFASGIFHPYYVSALAPFTAALMGAGVVTMVGRRAPAAEVARANDEPTTYAAPVAATSAVAPPAVAATAAVELPIAPKGGLWNDPVGRVETSAKAPAPASPVDAPAMPAQVAAAAPAQDDTRLLRIIGGLSLLGGAITERVVLGDATQLGWLGPVLLVATIIAGIALVVSGSRSVRIAAVGAASALLLVAPAVWSAQTQSHATNGTFPTGGPASASGGFGGPGGGAGGGRFRRNGTGGGVGGSGGFTPPAGGLPGGGFGGLPGAAQGGAGTQGRFVPPAGGFTPPGAAGATGAAPGGAPGGGGGMFGGNQTLVNSAVAYAKANGGGTVVVSGQSGAAAAILSSGANVAGIGGFSGRESEVTVSWFAQRVADGTARFVLTESGGLQDARTGSNTVMSAVAKTCTAVPSVSGLYDCQGRASALSSAGS